MDKLTRWGYILMAKKGVISLSARKFIISDNRGFSHGFVFTKLRSSVVGVFPVRGILCPLS